jgi:phosphoenolpyruvate carboxykinase (ATP)
MPRLAGAITSLAVKKLLLNYMPRWWLILKPHKVYATDVYAGADTKYSLRVRFINEYAWHQLFARQLFIDDIEQPLELPADFTVVCLPSVLADPKVDGTYSETFIILNFDARMVIIGGGSYAGEMKKSIFSVMNYLLPQKGVLTMHCSANVGHDGKVALFFGLPEPVKPHFRQIQIVL